MARRGIHYFNKRGVQLNVSGNLIGAILNPDQPTKTKKRVAKQRVRFRKEQKRIPSLTGLVDGHSGAVELDKIAKQMSLPLFKECYPETYASSVFGNATARVVKELLDSGKQSAITAPLISVIHDEAGGLLTQSDIANLLGQPTPRIRGYIRRGKGGWQTFCNANKRKATKHGRLSRIPVAEKTLIRSWVVSRCELDSNTNTYKCPLTRKKLYELYVLTGAPSVYFSMLSLEEL